MHVDEMLSVLIDGTPYVSLAFLVLVAPLLAARAGAGSGLLLGAVVAPRHYGLVGGFAAREQKVMLGYGVCELPLPCVVSTWI